MVWNVIQIMYNRSFVYLRTAGKFCCHISKAIGLTWTLRGVEHLGIDKPCVIVANHQSSLDILGNF